MVYVIENIGINDFFQALVFTVKPMGCLKKAWIFLGKTTERYTVGSVPGFPSHGESNQSGYD